MSEAITVASERFSVTASPPGPIIGAPDEGGPPVAVEWQTPDPPAYRHAVRLVPEEDGGFSVYVPSLPGVHSQGETEAEALVNIADALEAAIESYRESDEDVPWTNGDPAGQDEEERWIIVHV